MKNTFLLLLCSVITLYAHAENTIPAKSKIESVTVYRQGAEVVNTATVDVPAGMSEIVFEGLSNDVNASSLQVSGTSGIMLLSATYQLNYLSAQDKLPEAVKIEDSLQILGLQLTKLTAKKSVYQEEEKMLKANQSIGGANTGVSVAELQKAADFLRSRLLDVKAQIIDFEQSEKKLNERLTKLRNQLNELNQQRNRPQGEVVLNVSAKAATKVSLQISYLVNSAGWTPVYDLRTESINEPVHLFYKANVHQNTGVNWNKVKLTLSTGNPTLSQKNPEMNTWYIDFYQPYAFPGALKSLQMDQVIISGSKYEEGRFEDDKEQEKYTLQEAVTITEKQINAEFEIDIPYTIQSDGKDQLVAMSEYELPAEYFYIAVPKLDKDAYLVADITGWEAVNLLAGTANIFFEGNYVGQTNINLTETGDTLRVSFGRDNKIIVKREQLKEFTNRRFIAANKKETYAYEVSVRNTKKQAIKIEIQDQVPVSNNSGITVELEEKSGADYDSEKGKLTWKYDINPAESKAMRLIFSVKYPKGKTVAGL